MQWWIWLPHPRDTACRSGPKGSEVPCGFGSLLSTVRMGPCHSQLPVASSFSPIPRPERTAVGLYCVGHQHVRQGQPKVLLHTNLSRAPGSLSVFPFSMPSGWRAPAQLDACFPCLNPSLSNPLQRLNYHKWHGKTTLTWRSQAV